VTNVKTSILLQSGQENELLHLQTLLLLTESSVLLEETCSDLYVSSRTRKYDCTS
jgi:hypothetical protein